MKKFTSIVLTFILVLGLTLPAHAFQMPEFQIPESYDFTMDFTMSFDTPDEPEVNFMMALIFGGSDIAVSINGSMVNDGAASQLYMEMLIGTGMFGNAPIRFWLDMDFNDIKAPTMEIIVELPVILRMFLAMENRELNRQFMVFDLSEILAEGFADMPTQEEFETVWAEAMEELNAAFGESFFAELLEFVDIVNFSFEYSEEDGYLTGVNLALDVVLDPDNDPVGIEFTFDMEITNINNTTVEFPTLTLMNSVDVLALID